MMCITITHQGVPVGTVDLKLNASGELGGGDVEPLPGYEAIRASVADASSALWNLGFLGPVSAGSAERGEEALRRAVELEKALEQRDERGRLVPTEAVDIFHAFGSRAPVVMVWFRTAAGAVPAVERHPRAATGDASRPDA